MSGPVQDARLPLLQEPGQPPQWNRSVQDSCREQRDLVHARQTIAASMEPVRAGPVQPRSYGTRTAWRPRCFNRAGSCGTGAAVGLAWSWGNNVASTEPSMRGPVQVRCSRCCSPAGVGGASTEPVRAGPVQAALVVFAVPGLRLTLQRSRSVRGPVQGIDPLGGPGRHGRAPTEPVRAGPVQAQDSEPLMSGIWELQRSRSARDRCKPARRRLEGQHSPGRFNGASCLRGTGARPMSRPSARPRKCFNGAGLPRTGARACGLRL